MNKKTIGEISKFTGVSAHTIKYYEKIGLISSGKRDKSNYRAYQVNTCTDIYECMKCRNMDFSLKDTEKIVKGVDSQALTHMMKNRRDEIEEQIHLLEQRKSAVDRYLTELQEIDQRMDQWYIEEVPDFYLKKQTENMEYLNQESAMAGGDSFTYLHSECKTVVCLNQKFLQELTPSFSWGLGGFLKEDLENDGQGIAHISKGRAFVTYLKVSGNYVTNGEIARIVKSRFLEFQREIPGNAYGIRVKIVKEEDGVFWHYFKVFLPVK